MVIYIILCVFIGSCLHKFTVNDVLFVIGDSSENDFTNLALEMSVWNSHKDNVHDCSHDDDIRCFAYIMDGGMCIRTNTLVTYCEANRQVGQLITCF